MNENIEFPYYDEEGGNLRDRYKKFKEHKNVKAIREFADKFKCDTLAGDNALGEKKYEKYFENALFSAKGSILFLLILVSSVYQVLYKNVKGANTLLSSSSGKVKVFVDGGITALFGIFSVMFVQWSRHGWEGLITLGAFKAYFIVGLILGLFNFAQEASGMNRYLDEANILNGTGIYYQLDNDPTNTANTAENVSVFNLADLENGGDPFIKSLSYLFVGLISCLLLCAIFVMFKITLCGWSYEEHSIFNTERILNGKPTGGKFMLELLAVGLINFIPPMLSPKIRGQQYTAMSGLMGVGIFIIAITLQIMFQYSGMLYTPHTKGTSDK